MSVSVHSPTLSSALTLSQLLVMLCIVTGSSIHDLEAAVHLQPGITDRWRLHTAFADTPDGYFANHPTAKKLTARYGLKKQDLQKLLTPAPKGAFASLLVPEGKAPKAGWSLCIFVPPVDQASGFLTHQSYMPIFAKHRVIVIAPHGAGNKQPVLLRMRLALDCLASIKASNIPLDAKRMWIAGFSGGGSVACLTAGHWPSYWTGVMCFGKACLLDNYPISKNRHYLGNFPHLNAKERKTLESLQWIFITGKKDFNYDSFARMSQQWSKTHIPVTIFDVPGLAHTMPPAKQMGSIWAESETLLAGGSSKLFPYKAPKTQAKTKK